MLKNRINTYKILINGRVQGVGFRPFVFNLARRLSLHGSVSNNENGVIIYINTSSDTAEEFVRILNNEKPKVSEITKQSIEKIPTLIFDDFQIVISQKNDFISIPLTPDFAICDQCKLEITNDEDRRYKYAFTTCVNCGPRYSITEKYPFDRIHTSISNFEMCDSCLEEYHQPFNKRFHSQTNSCGDCGVTLKLEDKNGMLVSDDQKSIIISVADRVRQGDIVAIKNTNGYLLCCDAFNSNSITRLRKQKKRPKKPFAVLYPDLESIKNDFKVSQQEMKSLTSEVAPIIILNNTKETTLKSEDIAPNSYQTGVMLPSSGLLHLLMQELNQPIIATSGNIHGSPIIADPIIAYRELKSVADCFLHHNLKIQFPQDDSVLKFVQNQMIILRRSRGLSPSYLDYKEKIAKPLIAMGSHLKSTFTFVTQQQVYISQYFGNLDNFDVYERYRKTFFDYVNLFETRPKTVLVDQHPQYLSTQLGCDLAKKFNIDLISIQHHKAHFASVLGEFNLFSSQEKILGVIWDGTGLGDDHQIWGGEFFIYQNHRMKRLEHFEYYDWLANEKMSKEPRLSLLSLLYEENRETIKHKFSEVEWKIYNKMLASDNIKTSSIGRLFDSVASLLNLLDYNTFEGEGGLVLENLALKYTGIDFIDYFENEEKSLNSKRLINLILESKTKGVSLEKIAASFIYSLAKVIINVSNRLDCEIIACSGGVFQNSLLVKMLNELAVKHYKSLKINCKLSVNDENISFGQFMYYQHCKD